MAGEASLAGETLTTSSKQEVYVLLKVVLIHEAGLVGWVSARGQLGAPRIQKVAAAV